MVPVIAHFRSRSPCTVCGCRISTEALAGTIRVNKRSIRVTSQPFFKVIMIGRGYDLGIWPTACPECGSRDLTQLDRAPAALHPDTRAEVESYRAKRWPDLPATAEAQQREAS